MSKTLVVCIDGTWNAPGQKDTDPVSREEYMVQTNVARTWEALARADLDPDRNRSYGSVCVLPFQDGEAIYLNGVGSEGNAAARLWAGSTGTGTSERILDAYRFIAERWQPGDRIFGFGFSRGAFAVRSLAGFINAVGLPRSKKLLKEDDLSELFEVYRDRKPLPPWTQKADIDFLGVWDTVGALAFGRTFSNYHDISPPNVNHVCHALALDEERESFLPELWQQQAPHQKIEQVWFMGAHANVGGGYIDENLSNIALFWVLKNAVASGLKLYLRGTRGWLSEDINGVRRPSYKDYFKGLGFLGNVIVKFNLRREIRTVPPTHLVHESVKEAMQEGNYQPAAEVAGVKIDALTQLGIEPWGI